MREKGCTFHPCGLLIPGNIKNGNRFLSYDNKAVDASVLILIYDDVAEKVTNIASNEDNNENKNNGGSPSTPTVEVVTPKRAWTVGIDEDIGSSVNLKRSNRATKPQQNQQNGADEEENAIIDTPSRPRRRKARKSPNESNAEFSQLRTPLPSNGTGASAIRDDESIDLGAEFNEIERGDEVKSERQTNGGVEVFDRRASITKSLTTAFPDRSQPTSQPTNLESAEPSEFDLDDPNYFNTFTQDKTADNDSIRSPKAFAVDATRIRDDSQSVEGDSSCRCNYCVLVSREPSKSLTGLLPKLHGPDGYEVLMNALQTLEGQPTEGFWWCQDQGYTSLASALRFADCMTPSKGVLNLMKDLYELIDVVTTCPVQRPSIMHLFASSLSLNSKTILQKSYM